MARQHSNDPAVTSAAPCQNGGVSGAPSDRIVGLGLGTADAPDYTIHTCFYLVFRPVYR